MGAVVPAAAVVATPGPTTAPVLTVAAYIAGDFTLAESATVADGVPVAVEGPGLTWPRTVGTWFTPPSAFRITFGGIAPPGLLIMACGGALSTGVDPEEEPGVALVAPGEVDGADVPGFPSPAVRFVEQPPATNKASVRDRAVRPVASRSFDAAVLRIWPPCSVRKS